MGHESKLAKVLTRSSSIKPDAGFAARALALDILQDVEEKSLYANLATPDYLTRSDLVTRDRAFVTELVYGTLRRRIFYDAIIESASSRPVNHIDLKVLHILRITAHQLLTLNTPAHAAVDSAVRLAIRKGVGSASGFVNAISRRISERKIDSWIEVLSRGRKELELLSVTYSHPEWIVAAYLQRLGNIDEVRAELEANNINPSINAVIYPGATWSDSSVEQSKSAHWSADCRIFAGNPEEIPEIRNLTAGIQDEGSYLIAQAFASIPTSSRGPWVDLCAGPGGKAAVISRIAQTSGYEFLAIDRSEHRAKLVTRVTKKVVVADGSKPPLPSQSVGKILVDAPCSGLGALRRRPDARYRKSPQDIEALVTVQRALLAASIQLLEVGGILGYVTCSPIFAETRANTDWMLANFSQMELVDARQYFPVEMNLDESHDVQLWPSKHGTDAMYLALFRKIGD